MEQLEHKSESAIRKPWHLLTSEEVAERLCVNVRDVYALCRSGELRFVRVTPRKHRFREEDLEEFVNRKLTPGKARPIDKSDALPVRSTAKMDKAEIKRRLSAW